MGIMGIFHKKKMAFFKGFSSLGGENASLGSLGDNSKKGW
jgi:hypothetical protein